MNELLGKLRETVDSDLELGGLVMVLGESLRLAGRAALGPDEECTVRRGVSDPSWTRLFWTSGLGEEKVVVCCGYSCQGRHSGRGGVTELLRWGGDSA